MKNSSKLITLSAIMVAGSSYCLAADAVETSLDSTFAKLEEAVPGKFSINTRIRYEEFETPAVDLGGVSQRTRLGYMTENFGGFTGMIEGELLSAIGDDEEIHPLDRRGEGAEINQLWVAYADKDFGNAKLGKQVYTLDDHRFIGHVGWRQNIQTFNALTGAFTMVDGLTLKAFFIDEQQTVFANNNDLNVFGINASYVVAPELTVTAFGYSLEGEDILAQGNDTVGVRLTGSKKFEDVTVKYAFSYAYQEDAYDSPLTYDADYKAGDVSAVFSGVTLGAGFEILEPGFRTPLATVHKFNGYADALLPLAGFTEGLEDMYVYVGYKIPVGNGIGAKLIYHWFDSETGAAGFDGGTEIDAVLTYKVNKYINLMAKYGDFETDGGVGNAGGVDKRMFTFDVNFAY